MVGQSDSDQPIMDDYIMDAIGRCLSGLDRVDFEFDGWKVKAYWAGPVLRIDMTSELWSKRNIIPLKGGD